MGRHHQLRRVADLTLIIVASPLWVPVLLALALAVVVTSGRPILFIQDRVGQHGNTFAMRKFRSMKNGNNPLIPDPDRITGIGTILRRTSLDELPQLLNVLEGSMSLVGPRPMLPPQVAELTATQRGRLTVLPGLTGLAQINGRNDLTWEQRFSYDLEWARNPSLSSYAMILAKTASTVISGDGVTGHDADDRFAQAVTDIANLDLAALQLDDEHRRVAPLFGEHAA